jgi:ribosomal-protein-alanine N-acetyltransferase
MQLKIQTSRLTILPFTFNICEESLSNSFGIIASMGICPGNGWPDPETLDTLPRIIKNLSKVNQPSGFES